MSDIEIGRAEGLGKEEIKRAEMRFRAPLERKPPADWVPLAQHFMEVLCKPKGK
jgi:hypothetical protein